MGSTTTRDKKDGEVKEKGRLNFLIEMKRLETPLSHMESVKFASLIEKKHRILGLLEPDQHNLWRGPDPERRAPRSNAAGGIDK